MEDLRGKRVTVAGLGKFGGQVAAVKWLVQQGARVLVTDRDTAEKFPESVKALENFPIDWRLGEHRVEDFTGADLVVASPAIPPHNKFLLAAKQAGVPVTAEIRLFIERCPASILAVTGTKGKSTTTSLLGLMLAKRFNTHVGGNIGRPLLLELDRIERTDLVVLELSSFMLEYLRELQWSPHVAVVTMLATDHLDWHGSSEAYLDAKKLIVRYQHPDDFAVLGEGLPHMADFAKATRARVVWYSMRALSFELVIPGEHNQLNAQAAFAAAHVMGVTRDQAQDAVRNFPGLTHRLELVHEENGVRYYNDSIATIPEAAVAALGAFPPKRVIQIVGGSDKGLSFTAMCGALNERAKAVLCIGKTGPTIAELMARSDIPQRASVYQCGDLQTAMTLAKSIATPGDVVLLSTGCASYDQFTNFEQRGQRFAELARRSHR